MDVQIKRFCVRKILLACRPKQEASYHPVAGDANRASRVEVSHANQESGATRSKILKPGVAQKCTIDTLRLKFCEAEVVKGQQAYFGTRNLRREDEPDEIRDIDEVPIETKVVLLKSSQQS